MRIIPKYTPKIAIIGCGNVGTRYAYALTIQGVARHVVMVDINKQRAEGEAMDLSHGAPYYSPVKIEAGDYPEINDADLIVITAGRNQNPGEARLDLLRDNARLFQDIIPQCMQYAPDAKFLVVTNPVDALSYVAYKLSNKPAREVIGAGTVLDSARFRFLIGVHCEVDPRNVHAYIFGEHGDSEFPAWSNAMIGGMPLQEYCSLCGRGQECLQEEEWDGIFQEVKNSANEIISRKGETSFGIGLALARISRAILNDENTILPVSTLLDGFLGISDIYLSLPVLLNKNGVKNVLNVSLSPEEQNQFLRSAEIVKNALLTLDISG